MWLDIREPGTNKLLLRYDPDRAIIEVRRRGRITLVDLTKYPSSVKLSIKVTETAARTE